MITFHRKHFRCLTAIFSLFLLLISMGPFAQAAQEAGEIKFDCKASGGAKGYINGQPFPVDCGANTPTKSGSITAVHPCVGSSFRCMKGKECIDIEGGFKFHQTNCGSGGKASTGAIRTAGCVEIGDPKIWSQLKSLVGKNYDLKGPGGASGR